MANVGALLFGAGAAALLIAAGAKRRDRLPPELLYRAPNMTPKDGSPPIDLDAIAAARRAVDDFERAQAQAEQDASKIVATEEAQKRADHLKRVREIYESQAKQKLKPGRTHEAQPSPSADTPQLPAGYDPARARAMARSVANHLNNRKTAGYARELVKTFQRAAGIAIDGVYGGETRGALIYYGAKDPPKPFFKPFDTIAYVTPEQRGK